ncbi:MAG: APC family permease [Candidatus Diapherotrites archaeon]
MLHKNHVEKAKLSRSLSLFEATIYGVGVIIGAGIYALIGEGVQIAGSMVWLSFVFGAIIAAFTALSYAELSSLFPKTGAEFNFVKHAFRSNYLAFFTGYSGIFANLISVSVVALGFAGYLNGMTGINISFAAISLIILMTLLNFFGIKESAKYAVFSTILEVFGIILIILIGLPYLGSTNLFEVPDSKFFLSPVLFATSLIFFAFVGFEQIANISEETKLASKTIPKAVLLSLFITSMLYILVSISVVSIYHWQEIAGVPNPMSLVAQKGFGENAGLLMSLIALFATSNTVLILLVVTSRMIYGISKQSALPDILQTIHEKTNTPYIAVLLTGLLSLLFIFLKELDKVALLSNYFIFTLFFLVNVSTIKMRISHPHLYRPFKIPFNIGEIPIVSVLGAIFCLFMLAQINTPIEIFGVELPLILFGFIISLSSIPIYILFKHTIPKHERI